MNILNLPKMAGRAPGRYSQRVSSSFFLSTLILLANSGFARADATDDYVRAEMAKRQIPGLSVAVIRNGKTVKEGSYGVASVELRVSATAETSYSLASMTKVFTASAIMLLVQEERISLDEPVARILQQLPPRWSAVTIRECLAHTSGLPDSITDDINLTPLVKGDREALLDELFKMPVHPAGERVVYNQTEYVLLGMVIEKVSGLSYEQFVQKRLIEPAGITGMRFGDAWAVIPGRADLYTNLNITTDHSKLLVRDGQPISLPSGILRYGSKVWPDYDMPWVGLNGSIRDLEKWEAVLSGGKFLMAASLAEMTKAYQLKDGKDGSFGLSFVVKSVGPYKIVAYGGGAATWRIGIPSEHLSVIVLTNLQGSSPETLALGIATLYVPGLKGLR